MTGDGVKKCWGVRRESGLGSIVERSVNPTEEKIAKEIRELKEREEELVRLRENPPLANDAVEEVVEVKAEEVKPKTANSVKFNDTVKTNTDRYKI